MEKLENGSVVLTEEDQFVINALIDNIIIRQPWGTVERGGNGMPLTIELLTHIRDMISGVA